MTKSEAEAIGREMKKRLGAGWRITVHNNCGWHVHANKGPLYVGCTYGGEKHPPTYMCLMSSDPAQYPNCGEVYWTVRHGKTHTDPVEAVVEQVEASRRFINKNLAVVNEAEQALKDFSCACCGKKRYE